MNLLLGVSQAVYLAMQDKCDARMQLLLPERSCEEHLYMMYAGLPLKLIYIILLYNYSVEI